jgi:hypothetical protein
MVIHCLTENALMFWHLTFTILQEMQYKTAHLNGKPITYWLQLLSHDTAPSHQMKHKWKFSEPLFHLLLFFFYCLFNDTFIIETLMSSACFCSHWQQCIMNLFVDNRLFQNKRLPQGTSFLINIEGSLKVVIPDIYLIHNYWMVPQDKTQNQDIW